VSKPVSHEEEWRRAMVHARNKIAKLRKNAFDDPNAPPALIEHCGKIAADASAVIALLQAREVMEGD
jgi:hypothetical protein